MINKKNIILISVIVLASIVFVLGLYNNPAGSAEPASLRIGIVGAAPTGHLGVSIREGYLDEELAKVNAKSEVIANVGGGNPIAELLGSGSADITVSGDIPIINAIGSGIDVDIIAIEPFGGSRNSFVVLNGSEIKSIKDLKGKKVSGGSLGGNGHLFTYYILTKFGLSPKDVTIVNLETTDAQAALLNKNIDAAVLGVTTAAKYEREGSMKILFDVSQDPEWPGQGLNVVRRTYGKNNPEIVIAYLKAQIRAQEWMKDHPDEFLRQESNTSKLPVWVYKKQYPNNEFIQSFSITRSEIDRLDLAKKNLIDSGICKADFDFDIAPRVDKNYLEAALKDLNES